MPKPSSIGAGLWHELDKTTAVRYDGFDMVAQ